MKHLFSKTTWLIGLVILGLLVSGCGVPLIAATTVRGSGNAISESRNVSGFTSITLAGIGKLIVEQTGSESLTITADDNLLPYLTSEVRGNRLILGIKNNTSIAYAKEIAYRVTVKALDGFELSGAGDAELRSISMDRLQVISSGAGNITASGKADRQEITLTGAGRFDGESLEGREATVTLSGAGGAVVRVSDKLNAQINGMGSVEYIGNPEVTEDINGLGSVKRR